MLATTQLPGEHCPAASAPRAQAWAAGARRGCDIAMDAVAGLNYLHDLNCAHLARARPAARARHCAPPQRLKLETSLLSRRPVWGVGSAWQCAGRGVASSVLIQLRVGAQTSCAGLPSLASMHDCRAWRPARVPQDVKSPNILIREQVSGKRQVVAKLGARPRTGLCSARLHGIGL